MTDCFLIVYAKENSDSKTIYRIENSFKDIDEKKLIRVFDYFFVFLGGDRKDILRRMTVLYNEKKDFRFVLAPADASGIRGLVSTTAAKKIDDYKRLVSD